MNSYKINTNFKDDKAPLANLPHHKFKPISPVVRILNDKQFINNVLHVLHVRQSVIIDWNC